MNALLRIPVLFAAVCMLPVPLIAQSMGASSAEGASLPTNTIGNINPYNILQKHWLVAGKVTTLRGDPVAGAKVDVMPTGASGEFRTLVTDFQGAFQTDYWLNAELVKEFGVDLKVTKKGFLKAHSLIDFGASEKTWVIPVTLREPEEDSELLSQADLISGLAPRLKKLGASDGLSAAAEKDYARGVEEFLDRSRSDRALPSFTKVTRRDASCMPCRTMLALAELDSGDWDGAYHNLAEVFNKALADRSLGRPEPLLALGVMESWRHQPRNAAGYFIEALKYAPQDPLALQELGRSQLLMQNWGPADQYLSKAIAAGAGPEARLLHVEALLGGDQFQAASTEMTRYLAGRDVKKMPIQVRQLWAQIENRKKVEAAYAKPKPKGEQALDYLHRPPPDLTGLEPATDQGQLDSILSAVGKTVAEFFGNFPSTSSLEQIHQEKLRRKQKVGATLDQKFRYLCFTPAAEWGPGFDEYRADLLGIQALPQGLQDGFMLTSGFASASLLFHPKYQSQTAFRYLGRQKVNGRDTYVIAFAQQPGKARLNGAFKSGQISMTTFSQGLAWIDSQSYQITRLRTDLLKPLPEINLERETTEIAFGEVHFKGIAEGFWLPQQVTVAVDWNGKHFRNEHRYSEFKVFNVEATQKIRKPREVEQTSKQAPDSQVVP
jgi:tetratricopeptide (TPR) repeat protein